MEQRITFDFDFQKLTDYYLGRASNSLKVCLFPATLRRAAKKARSEQLYVVLRDEEKPMVVWKKFGKDPITFLAEEVEDMIVTMKPPLGGTRTVVKLVGEDKELLEIYSLLEPELFVDTVQDMKGGAGGRIAHKDSQAAPEMHDTTTHATTQILARDPLVSEPRPVLNRISPPQVTPPQHQAPNRSIRGQGSDRGKSPPMHVAPSQPSSRVPRKQASIGGEPYSNPLFAHGKIRYHMILPEAVPSHLFYSRPEVEALTSGNGANRPVQEVLQEEERKRMQREDEEMRLGPSAANGGKRSRMGSSDGRRPPDLMQRVSEENENPPQQDSSTHRRPSQQHSWREEQQGTSTHRRPSKQRSWREEQMLSSQTALPARPPSIFGSTNGDVDRALPNFPGQLARRSGPLMSGLGRSESQNIGPPSSLMLSTNSDIAAVVAAKGAKRPSSNGEGSSPKEAGPSSSRAPPSSSLSQQRPQAKQQDAGT